MTTSRKEEVVDSERSLPKIQLKRTMDTERMTHAVVAETTEPGTQRRMLAKSVSATKSSLHPKRLGRDRGRLHREEDREAEKKWKTKAS